MKRKEEKIMQKTNSRRENFQLAIVEESHKRRLVHNKTKPLQKKKNVSLPDLQLPIIRLTKVDISNFNKAKNCSPPLPTTTTSIPPPHQISSHLNPTVVLNKSDGIVVAQYSPLSNSGNSKDHIPLTKTTYNMGDTLLCNTDSNETASPLASAASQQTKLRYSTRLSGTKFKVISEWRPYKPKLKAISLKQEPMQSFENPGNMNNEGSSNVTNCRVIKREITSLPISMSEKSCNRMTSNVQPINLVSDKTPILETPDIKPSMEDLSKAAKKYQCQSINIKLHHNAAKIGQNSLKKCINFSNDKPSLITQNHPYHNNKNCNNQLQHSPEHITKSATTDKYVRKVSSKQNQEKIFGKSIPSACQYSQAVPESSNQQIRHKTSKHSSACSGLPTFGSIYSTSKLDAIQHLKDCPTKYITAMIKILIHKYPKLEGLLSRKPLTDKSLINLFSNILKKAKRFENSTCKMRKIFLRTVFNLKMNLHASNYSKRITIEEKEAAEKEETTLAVKVRNLEKNKTIGVNSCNSTNSTLEEMADQIESSNNQFGNVVSCMRENTSSSKSYDDVTISKPVQHNNNNTVTQKTDVAVQQEVLMDSCSTGRCDLSLSQHLSNLKARYSSALTQLTMKNKLINELEKKLEQLNNKEKEYVTKIENYRIEMLELDTFVSNQTALVAFNSNKI